MKKSPLISIVVPVYNAEKTIETCVNSIKNQTYKNLEIILVDDGSKDESFKKCEKLASEDSRIKVFKKENGGASSARNFGLNQSKGEFIQFVDSDDTISEDYTESLYVPFQQDDTIDLSVAGFTIVNRDSKIEDVPISCRLLDKNKKEDNDEINDLCIHTKFGFLPSPINKLYRATKCGRFDMSLRVAEDTVFNIEYLKNASKIFIVNNSGYFYYLNDNSLTHKYYEDVFIDLQTSKDCLIEYLKMNTTNLSVEVLDELNISVLLKTVRHMILNKSNKKAIYNCIDKIKQNINFIECLKQKSCSIKYRIIKFLLNKNKYFIFLFVCHLILMTKNKNNKL